jgi:hypothetical protein
MWLGCCPTLAAQVGANETAASRGHQQCTAAACAWQLAYVHDVMMVKRLLLHQGLHRMTVALVTTCLRQHRCIVHHKRSCFAKELWQQAVAECGDRVLHLNSPTYRIAQIHTLGLQWQLCAASYTTHIVTLSAARRCYHLPTTNSAVIPNPAAAIPTLLPQCYELLLQVQVQHELLPA